MDEKKSEQARKGGRKRIQGEDQFTKIFLGLIVVIILLYSINLVNTGMAISKLSDSIEELEETNRPAELQVIRIIDEGCISCSDVSTTVSQLSSTGLVNFTKHSTLDYRSEEAQNWITKLGIRRIPALILTGEVEKESIQGLWTNDWKLQTVDGKEGGAYYSNTQPPYVDPVSKQVVGLVSVTNIVDSSCDDCWDPNEFVSGLESSGVVFSSKREIEYTSDEAQSIIKTHNVQRIPAISISSNIMEYDAVAILLDQLNPIKRNGSFAFPALIPPYRNLTTNKIDGRVSIIYLDDSSCTDCYDVLVNKQILSRSFGITPIDEETVDVSSSRGKALLSKYSITKVPTILLSPDAKAYPPFLNAWSQVGEVANDGWYILIKPEVLGTIQDLSLQ